MCKRNDNGSSTVPCGTPEVSSDLTPSVHDNTLSPSYGKTSNPSMYVTIDAVLLQLSM